MAHIADLMGEGDSTMGMNNYIARELSPSPVQQEAVFQDLPGPRSEDKEKFVWRMHQPTESRKYQLFPPKRKSQESILLSGNSDKASSRLGTSVGGRLKEQTLVRRRKVSVPELIAPTPMTTVQEIPIDSPTIPGRPALHERSISAPGNYWRQRPSGESITYCISGLALNENTEMILDNSGQESNPGVHLFRRFTPSPQRQPISPKTLAPLEIPQTFSRANVHDASLRSRSESIPPSVPPKSARTRDGSLPLPRASPYTPASATSLLSASTVPTSVFNTPNSAFPPLIDDQTNISTTQFTTKLANPSPAKGHSRNQSDVDNKNQRSFVLTHGPSHRRHESESAASIGDRGRPKKRPELSPSANSSPIISRQSQNIAYPTSTSPPREALAIRETAAKDPAIAAARAQAEAQHAFEHLPTGIRPHLAPNHLPLAELASLKKQALGQASRFQVLPIHAVEALSRELRALDERCEYLRKTHHSLRSGRKNLHERICNYLRGERTALFSRESLLRQEEALSELDNSIDDWVAKLEQAENRRTRIRQKLLEHVAAALIIPQLPASNVIAVPNIVAPSPLVTRGTGNSNNATKPSMVTMVTNTQVQAKVPADLNTPPRSPNKGQSSERLQRVVEEIKFSSPEPPKRVGRKEESIRIYAESDVCALLADVEEEIERMGAGAVAQELDSRVFERVVKVDKKVEIKKVEIKKVEIKKVEINKKDDILSLGIRLHAVAFDMVAYKQSIGILRA